MKIFVAGATGALGRRLVPMLRASGHDVVAMTRSPENEQSLRAAGAEPVVADGLDRAAVMTAVMRSEPDVVIHQMTGLAGVTSFKKLDEELAPTNRLRTEGLHNLVEAARAAGARRMIAQSYGIWRYDGTGGPHTEEIPLDPSPPATMRQTLDAIRHVESTVPALEGIGGLVLRYGLFYGPGTGIAQAGPIAEAVRRRKFPVIGDGNGVWSLVHIDDAAAATVLAVERGAPGVYNVADDQPSPIREWLPAFAGAIGAPPPRHVPEWLGRIAAGESGVYLHTRIEGLSNATARRELGWQPRYAGHRDGFRLGLAAVDVPAPGRGSAAA